MAISVNGGSGYGSRRRRGGTGSLAEINVTPFVDVVLVLLIIFMLTAHVMEFGIEVDVPKVAVVKDSAQELPVVTMTKNGDITLNGKMVNYHELGAVIHAQFPKATAVYVRADRQTIFDGVAQVLAVLGEAKFQVNIVTQPEDSASKGGK
ncbi:MAG TPA: biopolymer transporter ExbD [Candidatus Sulfopaludibacter sp.]|jgi:biopolymer transport protein ExbD|nr:biopolymer transporter ExbD [Candidatus Sulfopaludibacter sp.]